MNLVRKAVTEGVLMSIHRTTGQIMEVLIWNTIVNSIWDQCEDAMGVTYSSWGHTTGWIENVK